MENESVIQDPVNYPYAASVTDKGWQFEEAIPWTLLLQDMKDKTGEDIPAPAKGSVVTALFIYNDYNANRELAGLYGSMADMSSFDWIPEQHGIELVLAGKKGEEPAPGNRRRDPCRDGSASCVCRRSCRSQTQNRG